MTIPSRRYRAADPLALVPMRLPCTRSCSTRIDRIPLPLFPEMTLPAPADVPPIVLFAPDTTKIPPLLPIAVVPAASVPTRFPCTRLPAEAWIRIPVAPAIERPFEEMTFPAAGRRPADGIARGAVEDDARAPVTQGDAYQWRRDR